MHIWLYIIEDIVSKNGLGYEYYMTFNDTTGKICDNQGETGQIFQY